MCEPEWSGFSDDCSQLACPSELADVDGENIEVYCNSRGACANTVNASIVCPDGTVESAEAWIEGARAAIRDPLTGTDDFVAEHVDCALGEVTFARCVCGEQGGFPPDCRFVAEAAAENTVFAAASRRRPALAELAVACAAAAVGALAVARAGAGGGGGGGRARRRLNS